MISSKVPSRGLQLFARPISLSITFSSAYSSGTTEVAANVPEPRVSSKQLAQFRKGAGGRSSFSGNVVTVFGATGRLGPSVVNRFAKHGSQLIIPYRCDPHWVKELKVVGDLGQILFFPFDLTDEETIRKAVKYSNVVVNLIGSNFATGRFSLYDVNEHGARRIAKVCAEMGVERLIHVSALNADPDHKPVLYKKASFLKSKGLGEVAVREEFPNATIIRPSVMYGQDNDGLVYPMLNHYRKMPILGWVKLYKAGEQTFKMPIFVNDVSLGIAKSAFDPNAVGKTFEFVGPHCYKLSELIDFMFAKARVTGRFGFHYYRHGHYFDPWYGLCSIACNFGRKFWRHRHADSNTFNFEWLEFVEATDDWLTGVPMLDDLGVHRLTEFEYMGGYCALQKSFVPGLEEHLGQLQKEPPLPLRSPPLLKQQIKPMKEITTAKRVFTPIVLKH